MWAVLKPMLWQDSSDGTTTYNDSLGPVDQRIVYLMSSLRGQLVKCITTLLPNTLIFFVGKKKKRETFSMQTLLTFFQ